MEFTKKLFSLSTTCVQTGTFIRRVIKKAFAFSERHPEISYDSLIRAFMFAKSSALHSEKFFTSSCGKFLRSSVDVRFNNICCSLTYVHELYKETSYRITFYLDDSFESECRLGKAVISHLWDTTEKTEDTTDKTEDTTEDNTKYTVALGFLDDIPVTCLSFKWCHAPFDDVKACYNCAFNHSCDTAIKYSFTTDNFQIVPAWVYSRYNINPIMTVALTQFFKALAYKVDEFGLKVRSHFVDFDGAVIIDDTFLTEELPF